MKYLELILIWVMFALGGIDTALENKKLCRVILRIVAIILPVIIININW